VLVTDDATVRELNRHYAGEDSATDVLSFSLQEGEEFAWPDGVQRLGEVIISLPTAERQAQEGGLPLEQEVAHLLVHGLLHLLGYDHREPAEERRMRQREDALLRSAGYDAGH
jgi:probable rRNA maturation factor